MRPPYQIGDYVEVRAVVRTARVIRGNSCHKVLRRDVLTKPKQGWIVGMIRRFEGEIRGGRYDDPGYLKCSKSVILWRVAQSLTNTALEVIAEDITRIAMARLDRPAPRCPLRLGTPWEVGQEERREEMKDWPRDLKGRWIKGKATP